MRDVISRSTTIRAMAPFLNLAWMFGYGIAAALIMSLALGLLIKIWNWITPLDEWEELKKGNVAVAIVLASVIIGFALVVASAISPG